MQYLAEVEKKSGGLLGGGKTALRLLACQKNADDGWKVLTGENNVVYTDKVGDRGPGALVMAELSGNEVRRVQGAARDILSIFKTHATLQGKLKEKDDDIEQWKESLTYQSQELNRRVMEVELREEKVQQMDEELNRLEQQRSEVEAMREEAQRLRAELEEKQRGLNESWENLQGQQAQGGHLAPAQVSALESHLSHLAESIGVADAVQGRVQHLAGQLQAHQSVLDEYWPLVQADGSLQSGALQEQLTSLRGHWQSWHEGQTTLALLQAEEQNLRRELETKQQYSEALQRQVKAQSLLQKQITHLAGGIDPDIAQQIDYEALENMPLEALEAKLSDLKKDYERTFNFVNDQEDELRLQLQAIEEVKAKMAEASEFDRLTLSTELADEQDSYRILDESMVDQRRTLHERKTILEQHQAILSRRQGNPGAGSETASETLDLLPVLTQLEADAAQQKQQLDKAHSEIEALAAKLRELEGQIESKTSEQQAVKAELDRFDDNFQKELTSGGSSGAAAAYQAVLNPAQEMVNELRQQFQDMQAELELIKGSQVTMESMRQAIGQLQSSQAVEQPALSHANPFSDAA